MERIVQLWWQVERWPLSLRLFGFGVFLLPLVPLLASGMGWSSLPGPLWAGALSLSELLAMAAYVGLLLPVLRRGLELRPSRSIPGRVIWVFLMPVVVGVFAWLSVSFTWPFLDALVRGRPMQAIHTVRDVTPGASKHCPRSIDVVGLPPMFNRICRLPRDTLRGIEPGMQIVVSGRGTAVWLIVSQVQTVRP